LSIAQGHLEGLEINLVQRPLIHDRTDRLPFELGLVADEVLDTSTHATTLQTPNVSGGHATSEIRIF
jgi:hypothetical protein